MVGPSQHTTDSRGTITMSLKRLFLGDDRDPVDQYRVLFGGDDPLALATAWARGVIDEQGIAPSDQVRVVAALRKVEPRLGLLPAAHLAKTLAR